MSNDSRNRLFIKKIEIQNCGRFYGSGHEILFSDLPDKNITIIYGDSGRGKSTIHELIYWCLYGKHKKHQEDEKQGLDYGLLNVDALENLKVGESVTGSVTLSLWDNAGEKYLLTRQLKATLLRESDKRDYNSLNNSRVPTGLEFEDSVKLIMKDESGEKFSEKNPKLVFNEIDKQFPQDLSDFFLFDGENLIKFRNQKSSVEFIRNGITKISGLGIVDALSIHSKETADKIQNYIGGKSAISAPFATRENRLNEEIQELKSKLQQLELEQKRKRALLEEINRKIALSKQGKELIVNQKKSESNKSLAAKELKQNESNFKDFLFEVIPQALIKDTLQNSEKIFERLETENKIPPSITRSAIDKILNSHPLMCICGREFEKNMDPKGPWTVLNKIKETIIEDDLSNGISLGRTLIEKMVDVTNKQKLTTAFDKFIQIRSEKRTQIQIFSAEYDEYAKQLSSYKDDFSEDLGETKNRHQNEYDDLVGQITLANMDLEDKQKEWDRNHHDLEEALGKEGKYDDEQIKITVGRAISKFARNLEKKIEEILRTETERATNQYFLESAPEKQSFDHVEISTNYDILPKDSQNRVPPLSKGQAHVLGLSYVAGIREITHTKTFLIIDSPLHNISGKSRNEISEVLSKYLPGVQLVLLVTDSEYLHGDDDGAEPVRNVLRRNGRVWKEYVIEQVENEGIQSREIKEFKRD